MELKCIIPLEYINYAGPLKETASRHILHLARRQLAFIVEMQVSCDQSLDKRLVLDIFYELIRGEVWLLLSAAMFVIGCQFLVRASAEVGAFPFPAHHHLVVKVFGVDWIVHQEQDRIALRDFSFQCIQLFLQEIIVAVIHGDKVHAAD